ncbi:tetratricopeptide repeat protein [Compostibacter hankyongensis]|uniref:Tetratricopeptide repeat protein n=1 Tax=Compostibacter hankyongensis TaxID=1007089 RepID=A0ABP8FQE5_9BACT
MARSLFPAFLIACLLLAGSSCRHADRQAGDKAAAQLSPEAAAWTDSIRAHPDSARFYAERARAFYRQKQYVPAGRDLEKAIQLSPAEAGYYFALGETEDALGKWQQAAGHFRQALQKAPANPQPYLRLAYIYFQHRQYPAALQLLDSLLDQHPGTAEGYGLRSQVLQEKGDTLAALPDMRKAVTLQPGNYDALMALGDLLGHLRKNEALRWYRRAYLLDTTRAEPLYAQAVFHEQQHDLSAALEQYRQSISTDRYYIPAYLGLGKIYMRGRQWKQALHIFTMATQVEPAGAEAFYQRGRCYEALDDSHRAVEDYRQAAALDSGYEAPRTALERLHSGGKK